MKFRFALNAMAVAAMLAIPLTSTGQSGVPANSFGTYFADVLKLQAQGDGAGALRELGKMRDQVDPGRDCGRYGMWLELSLNNEQDMRRKDSLLAEMEAVQSCLSREQLFFARSSRGGWYYAQGLLDSAFYSFSSGFELAQEGGDTNRMVVSMSNIAALYSELGWKSQALATALQAYSIAMGSKKVNDGTQKYLNNNVAALMLDLGYLDRASKILDDFTDGVLTESSSEIEVLRAVNVARLEIKRANGKAAQVQRALKVLEQNTSAWLMAAFFAVEEGTKEVRRAVLQDFVRMHSDLVPDTATYVEFGVAALGAISLDVPVDERVKLHVSLLRDVAKELPLGWSRTNFKLGVAQLFRNPDFWLDYWRDAHDLDLRDIQYAALKSEVLNDFSNQIQLEERIVEELRQSKKVVQILIILAGFILVASLILLFYVNGRYKRARLEYRSLMVENNRLSKEHLVQGTFWDEVRNLIQKSKTSVQVDALVDLLARRDQSQAPKIYDLDPEQVREFDLSPTELKVLTHLGYGYRNPEIAQILNISKAYVHNVRSKLRQKLPLAQDEELEDFAARLLGRIPVKKS